MTDEIKWFANKITLRGFGIFPQDFILIKRKLIGSYVKTILKSERGQDFDSLKLDCTWEETTSEYTISVNLEMNKEVVGFAESGTSPFFVLDAALQKLKAEIIPEEEQ